MVGDSGKIIRVKRVRGWITLLAALPFLALALVAGAYLRSDNWPGRNRQATGEIVRLRAEVRALTDENARLTGRQLTPEAEATPVAGPVEKLPEVPAARPASAPQPQRPPSDSDAENLVGPNQLQAGPVDSGVEDDFGKKADAVQRDGEVSTSGGDSPVPVEVKDLALDFDPDKNTVSVGFRIFNRRPDGEPLFGYAFVILKGGDQRPEQWLVFPEAPLNSQGPVSFKKGYDFSISNFMAIRFNPRQLPPAVVFERATVQVYDASGRLLLARDFHLNSRN